MEDFFNIVEQKEEVQIDAENLGLSHRKLTFGITMVLVALTMFL